MSKGVRDMRFYEGLVFNGSKVIPLILLLGLSFVINPGLVYSFSISLNRIEVRIPPAGIYNRDLIVRNTEGRDLIIRLYIQDWHKAVEGKSLGADTKKRFEWLKITPSEFELKKGETKRVNLKVNVPEDAKGELNAMIFINGSPVEREEGAIGINTSIGVPIYVMIEGTEIYEARVKDIKVMSKSPLKVKIGIENAGNVHIRPKGTIEVKSAKNEGLFTLMLNEFNYPVLPYTTRELQINSEKALPSGEYIFDINMEYNSKKYVTEMKIEVE